MESFWFSLNGTMPVFLIILLGYWLKERHFFPEGCIAGIDRLVFHVLMPCMLFVDMATTSIRDNFDPAFSTFCFAATLLSILAIWGLTVLFCKDKSIIGAFVQSSYRSSVAILGIALTASIYGDTSLVPQMIVAGVPVYNIMAVVILAIHSDQPAQGSSRIKATLRGIVTNPILVGIFAGLPFSLFDITLPDILLNPLTMLGDAASTIALLVIGASFEGAKALKKIKPTVLASLVKLVVLPALMLPCAYWLGFRDQALIVILIMSGSPTTCAAAIMAKNQHNDAVLSASIVMLTTVAAAVTLTGFLMILRSIGAV